MDNNTKNNNKNTDISEDNQENSNEFNPEEKIKKDTESVIEKESHLESQTSRDVFQKPVCFRIRALKAYFCMFTLFVTGAKPKH